MEVIKTQKRNLVMMQRSRGYITDALRELVTVRALIQSGASVDTQILEPVKVIEKELDEARSKVNALIIRERW